MADAKPIRRRLQPLDLSSPSEGAMPGAALPRPSTSFIGREREVAAVTGLLRRDVVRLVTLTGPGGVGKTRLALRVAHTLQDERTREIGYASITPITDPSLVGSAIARALGVRPSGALPLPVQLRAFLGTDRRVVLIDNLERVLAANRVIAEILDACPRLTMLATSREPLHISAEFEYPVAPLSVEHRPHSPDPDAPITNSQPLPDAVTLFEQRARSILPDFAITEDNVAEITDLCAQLDGLPLAIELAAARLKIFSLQELLARLDNRLGLLTGGPRDAPPRLQTMRAAIAWSHDLLTSDEASLFRRLSVFIGGFTLDAAAWVARATDGANEHVSDDTVVDLINALVDKNLVRRYTSSADESRFTLLETVRLFAQERLADSQEETVVRDRHADWCLHLAERTATAGSEETGVTAWLVHLETEHDNLRAALGWLERIGDSARMPRLVFAVDRLWSTGGHRVEAIMWYERVLASTANAPSATRLHALLDLGCHFQRQGRFDRASTTLAEALALAKEIGEPLDIAHVARALGLVALNDERYQQAKERFSEALGIYRRLNRDGDQNWIEYFFGIVAYGQGALAEADTRIERALAGHRERDDHLGLVVSLDALGVLRCEHGDYANAAFLLAEALPRWRELRNHEGIAEWLAAVARLAARRGDVVLAARWYGASESLLDAVGTPLVVPPPTQYHMAVAQVRAALGDTAFTAAWSDGRSLRLEHALTEAEEALVDSQPTTGRGDSALAKTIGLTPREWQVLQLVAAGRSNREIADSLSISVATVKRHLTTVLGKLDLPSRSALNTYAHTHGLIQSQ